MTVAELIARLQAMPQGARVLVASYEDGHDELEHVVSAWAVRRAPTNYAGDYDCRQSVEILQMMREISLQEPAEPEPVVWLGAAHLSGDVLEEEDA